MSWTTSNRSSQLPWNWPAIRANVLARDSRLCQINGIGCSRRATEVDHIIRGNNHHYSNLRAVCTVCHKYKTGLEARQGRMRLKELRKRPREQHPGLRKPGA